MKWQNAKQQRPIPMREVRVELEDGTVLDGCTYRPNHWRYSTGAVIDRNQVAMWRNYTPTEALERTTALCTAIEHDARNTVVDPAFAGKAGYDANVDRTRINANE